MKIIFVRHGETKDVSGKDKLLKEGKLQVEVLSKRLSKIKINEIYSSDLVRSKETARIIQKYIKLPIVFTPVLREYSDDTLFKSKRKLNKIQTSRLKKLESFLNKISKDKESEKTILLISHGVTNDFIISYFLKISIEKTPFFEQNYACINIIGWGQKANKKGWKLMLMNNTSHMPKNLRRSLPERK